MTEFESSTTGQRKCRHATARAASDIALTRTAPGELGQVGASLRHCFGTSDGGSDPFQDLLAKLGQTPS